jgi:hypothetical protein
MPLGRAIAGYNGSMLRGRATHAEFAVFAGFGQAPARARHNYIRYMFTTLAETDIRKTSSGGIFGMRYLDLSKMGLAVPLNNETSVSDLAEALRGQKFE